MITEERLKQRTETAAEKLLENQPREAWLTNLVRFQTLLAVLEPSKDNIKGTPIEKALQSLTL